MRVLIYTPTFWPNIGGVEDVAHTLAEGLADRGHDVTVLTPTQCSQERECKYQVARSASRAKIAELVRQSDIVHSNGIAMALLPLALMYGKPFTWTHHGYQLQSIDGAGWAAGQPAPLDPYQSLRHHLRASSPIAAIAGGVKLAVRRLASKLVSANIASSRHIAQRQPSPNEVILFNPYDRELLRTSFEQAAAELRTADATFTFMGRLITEKGVNDLLRAFANVKSRSEFGSSTLKIIGDGPERQPLQSLAQQLEISESITWTGLLQPEALKAEISRSGIFVLPSAWEEPGAISVMELMAAGKPLIVSERGFLSECAGGASVTFPNRDALALAQAMVSVASDLELQLELIRKGLERIEEFSPQKSIMEYERLFQRLVDQRRGQK